MTKQRYNEERSWDRNVYIKFRKQGGNQPRYVTEILKQEIILTRTRF